MKSMLSERSCASSTMTVSYSRNSGSACNSASSMPSVMNLITVSPLVWSAKRILQPTSRPKPTFSSSATRRATELAATRRGWVQAMRPRSPRPAARHIFGICVVLPEPVSPASTSTWLFWMAVTISSARPLMGSSGGYSIRKGQDFLGRDDMSMPAILGENRNPQPEMTNSVETTPEEKMYRRVLFVSGFDGWSVVIVAGLGTLLSLLFTSLNGIFVGLLLIGAGAMELHGRRLLRRRNAEGMRWLVRAQVFLLGVILVYCVSRLGSFDAETAMGNLTPEMQAALNEAGVTTADLMPLVHVAFFATYAIVAVVSLFFQGGLAMYYRSRTARVTAFLTGSPPSV